MSTDAPETRKKLRVDGLLNVRWSVSGRGGAVTQPRMGAKHHDTDGGRALTSRTTLENTACTACRADKSREEERESERASERERERESKRSAVT